MKSCIWFYSVDFWAEGQIKIDISKM
jgi:hypothetical protein